MRSIAIGPYQVSIVLLSMIVIAGSVVTAATYLWSTRSVHLRVDEPLSVSSFPNTTHVHPGENKTLDIVVLNSAAISYAVTLAFSLNDTAYQATYVTFSNFTYNIVPGSNNITAWMFIASGAHPMWLDLTIDFYRQ